MMCPSARYGAYGEQGVNSKYDLRFFLSLLSRTSQAYLAFLESNGNREAYWRTLSDAGVGKCGYLRQISEARGYPSPRNLWNLAPHLRPYYQV